MTYPATADVCLNIFSSCWPRLFDFPQGARIVEVGCAEADWIAPMKTARPDLHITGIDVRKTLRPSADATIQGDVLTYDVPPASVDAVVFISSLEHIGLGGYGDPIDADGDTHALQRVRTWLRPGGQVYFDVPYGERYEVVTTKYRRYDDAALAARLLPGWTERLRYLARPEHPDAPYLAMVLTA